MQKNIPDPDLNRLIDYLTRELTPEEHAAVEAWVMTNPKRQRLLTQLAEMWQTTQARNRPKADVAAMEHAMTQYMSTHAVAGCKGEAETEASLSRRAVSDPPRRAQRKGVVQQLQRTAWVALAASIAGIMIIGGQMITHRLSARDNSDIGVTVYATAKGERADITLSDGSTVALNVASRLEVPTDYGTGHRTLRLTGEAFFTVQHHSGAPFTVISGAAVTRVLGTSFLVRYYAADTATEIAVQNGRVAVREAVVSAGEHVWVSQDMTSRPEPVSVTRFGFVTGVLNLDGIALRDAVSELNRWYDVDVRFGDSMVAMRQISAGFSTRSSHELVEILTWTMQLRVVRDGRILTIFSR